MKNKDNPRKTEKTCDNHCNHDFMFLDKWQEKSITHWEFACRYCLDLWMISKDHDSNKMEVRKWTVIEFVEVKDYAKG